MNATALKIQMEEEREIDVVIQAIKREFGEDCFLPFKNEEPVKRLNIEECKERGHEVKPHWQGELCLDCDGWWRMECSVCGIQRFRCCC